MERLTIPDVRVDEHTTRRTMIDAEAVRERAMEIYWRLKSYEDTGLGPLEVRSLSAEWNAMMLLLNSIGSYDRLRELAEADKDGHVFVSELPSVDVAPVVHGHFERAEREVSDAVVLRGWECSVCKRFTRSNFVGSWNYCPNCGAKIGGDLDGQKV